MEGMYLMRFLLIIYREFLLYNSKEFFIKLVGFLNKYLIRKKYVVSK